MTLGPLKPGFALIAAQARAPVQLIAIRAAADLVPRGRPWWRLPAVLPVWMEISLDRRWAYDPARSARELTDEVEQHLQSVLRAPTHDRSTPRISCSSRATIRGRAC
jgi:1-acyl-sn-glycerol-3-phosphate acyltransferase